VEEEIGDLLFSLVNLARKLDLDPEAALRRSSSKFVRRFSAIEIAARKQGKRPVDMPMEEKESIWQASKAGEQKGEPEP
jgi:ATP diphosphatase